MPGARPGFFGKEQHYHDQKAGEKPKFTGQGSQDEVKHYWPQGDGKSCIVYITDHVGQGKQDHNEAKDIHINVMPDHHVGRYVEKRKEQGEDQRKPSAGADVIQEPQQCARQDNMQNQSDDLPGHEIVFKKETLGG